MLDVIMMGFTPTFYVLFFGELQNFWATVKATMGETERSCKGDHIDIECSVSAAIDSLLVAVSTPQSTSIVLRQASVAHRRRISRRHEKDISSRPKADSGRLQ